MSLRPNVDEHQIAQLVRDFTRAALLTQPENLVLFAQRYFNSMDPTQYTPKMPEPPQQEPKTETTKSAEFTPEVLYEVHTRLNDLDADQLQDFDTLKEVFEMAGVWNAQIGKLLKEKCEALKTVFEVCGDENGVMEVQQVIDVVADLVMVHDDIDEVLADQIMQYLLGQGFMESDAEVTSKFDGATSISYETLLEAPFLQELNSL